MTIQGNSIVDGSVGVTGSCVSTVELVLLQLVVIEENHEIGSVSVEWSEVFRGRG